MSERKSLYTMDLTREDRSTIIRFCLTRGDRATMRTGYLVRPLSMADLEAAFKERESEIDKRILEYKANMENFDPNNTNENLRSFFGGEPTKTEFCTYINDLIRQEQEARAQIRLSYHISVDMSALTPADIAFHMSLSPKVTFGYSNELHEECDFALTDKIRARLLSSSISDSDPFDGWDYGALYLDSNMALTYEDIEIMKNGEIMLSTVSHEEMFDVFFDTDDKKAFIDFEGQTKRNLEIWEKVK